MENLESIIKLVEKFEKKIRKEEIKRVQMRKQELLNLEIEVFEGSKLPEKYIAKIV